MTPDMEVWTEATGVVRIVELWLRDLKHCPSCKAESRWITCKCGTAMIPYYTGDEKPFLLQRPKRRRDKAGELVPLTEEQIQKRVRISMDRVLLLRLRTWQFRYKLEIPEILDMVVPFLRSQVKVKRGALGIKISALCGPGTEKILREQIRRQYPDKEHLALWEARERASQLHLEAQEEAGGLAPVVTPLNILDFDSVPAYVAAYVARTDRARLAKITTEHQTWRKRKRYRGNPW